MEGILLGIPEGISEEVQEKSPGENLGGIP